MNNVQEFAGVIQLVNCYLVVHINGSEKEFISNIPEIDIRVAQTTAEAFAKTNNIPICTTLLLADRPFMSVINDEGQWFPAELYPDKIVLLKNVGPVSPGDNQKWAIDMAQKIASINKRDYVPTIEIPLNKD